ncbi:MAG: type II toxin-antitoxin system RelE/ParE family toxin [Bryobacteraceae bacterium]
MGAYKVHEHAREDLDEIWKYLAEEGNSEIASRIEDEFFEAFALLSTQPDIGFRRPHLSSKPLRFWVMREYLIVYALEHDPLFIVAIIHGKHHPQTIARILTRRQPDSDTTSIGFGLVQRLPRGSQAMRHRRR